MVAKPKSHLASNFKQFNEVFNVLIPKVPMQWDVETGLFRKIKVFSKIYVMFYFNVYVVFGLLNLSSCIYIFQNPADLDLMQLVLAFANGLLCVVLPVLVSSFLIHWHDIVDSFDCYDQMLEILGKINPLDSTKFLKQSFMETEK